VVREIADRRCARSRDAPIRLPIKSAFTKRPFHLQHVANLKKSPGMMSSTSTTIDGLDFLKMKSWSKWDCDKVNQTVVENEKNS
jgi:hypothetical protein